MLPLPATTTTSGILSGIDRLLCSRPIECCTCSNLGRTIRTAGLSIRECSVIYGLYQAFILAAIPEELARLAVLHEQLGQHPRTPYSTPMHAPRCDCGTCVHSLENLLYCTNTGWTSVWERSITSVPFHTLAGACVGYFVGYALNTRQIRWSVLGVLITITLHGLNNFNPKLFYGGTSPEEATNLPTAGIEAILITGWPANIAILLLSCGLVVWLTRRSAS